MCVYIVAIHNNSVILLIFGLPFDRALPWHKMLAFSSIFNGLIHGFAFYVGGRAKTMQYAAKDHHHIFTHVSKAYGMECTGVSLCHPGLVACFAWRIMCSERSAMRCTPQKQGLSAVMDVAGSDDWIEFGHACRLGAAGCNGGHVCNCGCVCPCTLAGTQGCLALKAFETVLHSTAPEFVSACTQHASALPDVMHLRCSASHASSCVCVQCHG